MVGNLFARVVARNLAGLALMIGLGVIAASPSTASPGMSLTRDHDQFTDADRFDQPIGGWDTAKVVTMDFTFLQALAFNHPFGTWNTSGVESMRRMFSRAAAFDQPLGAWDVPHCRDDRDVHGGAESVCGQHDDALNGWSTHANQHGVTLDAPLAHYSSAGLGGREILTSDPMNWVINDAGKTEGTAPGIGSVTLAGTPTVGQSLTASVGAVTGDPARLRLRSQARPLNPMRAAEWPPAQASGARGGHRGITRIFIIWITGGVPAGLLFGGGAVETVVFGD